MKAIKLEDEDKGVGQLKELLHTSDVVVRFTKQNGEDRTMVCTLRDAVVEQYERKGEEKKHRPETLYVVWDLQKDAWRMFDSGSLYEYHAL